MLHYKFTSSDTTPPGEVPAGYAPPSGSVWDGTLSVTTAPVVQSSTVAATLRKVTLASSTPGAVIYWRLNGGDPWAVTASGIVSIPKSVETFYAYAAAPGYNVSSITTVSF